MDMHHHTIRQVITKHKVYEVKTIGDSFMIACESADVAVLVCNDIQSELLTQVWPAEILDAADACVHKNEEEIVLFQGLRVRIGVAIGDPKVVFDEVSKGYDYYGEVVNTAARVEGVAYGGQTLVTETVYDELSPKVREQCSTMNVGGVTLKGIEGKVHVYQLLPTHLDDREFKIPADGSFGLEHLDNDARRDRPLEEMTMAEIVVELRSLRAQLAQMDASLPVVDLGEEKPPAQKEENIPNEANPSPLVPPQIEAEKDALLPVVDLAEEKPPAQKEEKEDEESSYSDVALPPFVMAPAAGTSNGCGRVRPHASPLVPPQMDAPDV